MSTLKELRKTHQDLKSNLKLNAESFCKLLGFERYNFSNEEVDNVGNFYVQNFQHPERYKISIAELRNYFFAYCYMAFIKSNGGELVIDENKHSISYGKSIITQYGGIGYPWVGISIDAWIKRLEEGRFKGRLSEAINRNLVHQTE